MTVSELQKILENHPWNEKVKIGNFSTGVLEIIEVYTDPHGFLMLEGERSE